jgi:cytochrome b561
MLALVAVHAVAALKHHLLDRDDVLHRMLPLVKPRRGSAP